MKVVYFNHSGFLIEMEHVVLVFDYYTQQGRHDYFSPEDYPEKACFVFVSHRHEDHYDRRIFNWRGANYIVDKSITPESGVQGDILQVTANHSYEFHGLKIETLQSNDEGVAFIVEADGKIIYHAGDLNWWHWNGESEEFLTEIAKSYQDEIARLRGRSIDVAFVPADLRLDDKYDWAVKYFLSQTDTKVLFPMHFWGEFRACDMLQDILHKGKIVKITKPNQVFNV